MDLIEIYLKQNKLTDNDLKKITDQTTSTIEQSINNNINYDYNIYILSKLVNKSSAEVTSDLQILKDKLTSAQNLKIKFKHLSYYISTFAVITSFIYNSVITQLIKEILKKIASHPSKAISDSLTSTQLNIVFTILVLYALSCCFYMNSHKTVYSIINCSERILVFELIITIILNVPTYIFSNEISGLLINYSTNIWYTLLSLLTLTFAYISLSKYFLDLFFKMYYSNKAWNIKCNIIKKFNNIIHHFFNKLD